MSKAFEKKTYYAMTLDPVHVGTGGYRLGRVDNTITREPGTNLPKIPGSSIAGVTRAYTAMAVQSESETRKKYYRVIEISKDDGTKEQKIYSCAGKGADDGEGHCGDPDCEVCVPFGFSKKGNSFQGLAQFFDARILFFPVHSMIGPVWVTSRSTLNDFCETLKSQSITIEIDDRLDNDELIQTELVDANENLNLGWLLLKNKEKINPIKTAISSLLSLPSEVVDRLVLVSDKLFSQIVNDNLEVRTSVAIDPATGAAEDGALFTYEAIPRATVMWFDVVYNYPEYFRIRQNGGDQPIRHGQAHGNGWKWIEKNVVKGLAYIESLGVGGMGTRGMGRMKILNLGGH